LIYIHLHKMKVISKAIQNNKTISRKYICSNQGGQNYSPDLKWSSVPNAKSYVVLVFDPDAPSGTWFHWLLTNIAPEIIQLPALPANPKKILEVSGGKIKQGKNSWGKLGYIGPCPPPGKKHRYYYMVYALDTIINDVIYIPETFLATIKGHVIDKGHIIGIFQRQ